MLQMERSNVNSAPFPHAVKDGILPTELFRALRADFPSAQWFEEHNGETGGKGSRVGKGSGFDIYRGDSTYETLIKTSPAWAELDAYINSPAFIGKFLELFGDQLTELGCSASVTPDAYDREHIEPRDLLTEQKTVKDRIQAVLPKAFTRSKKDVTLFTRLDIEKSMAGYAKPPHCDRPNRLCSLIIYFTDMKAKGIEGGELNIYALKTPKAPSAHPRHPRPEDVDVVATLTPKENLGVFFPCSNNSYHGVNAITTPGCERDFLYINISTDNASAW